jgi:hypothetical protein
METMGTFVLPALPNGADDLSSTQRDSDFGPRLGLALCVR